MTPIEIANFLCNMQRELREWFIAQPNSHVALVHIMQVYRDNKMRVARIEELRRDGNMEFYVSIISVSDEDFMRFLRSYS